MKCRWKHCKYGGEVDKDEAVKVGIAYYHPQCYAEKEAIQKIIDVWHERVDPNPMEAILRKSVNDLILNQNVDGDFLLFALNYCLDNKWNIRNPFVLKAVSKDTKAIKAWEEEQNKAIKRGLRAQTSVYDEAPLDFEFDLPVTNKTKQTHKSSGVLKGWM